MRDSLIRATVWAAAGQRFSEEDAERYRTAGVMPFEVDHGGWKSDEKVIVVLADVVEDGAAIRLALQRALEDDEIDALIDSLPEDAAALAAEIDRDTLRAQLQEAIRYVPLDVDLRTDLTAGHIGRALKHLKRNREQGERLIALMEELETLVKQLSDADADERETREFNVKVAHILRLEAEVHRLLAELPDVPDDLRETFEHGYAVKVDELREAHKIATEFFAAQDRQDRLRERRRRRPAPVVVERRCANCQKKPARVDDLCKKCARAAGVGPRGKIGAGEEATPHKRRHG